MQLMLRCQSCGQVRLERGTALLFPAAPVVPCEQSRFQVWSGLGWVSSAVMKRRKGSRCRMMKRGVAANAGEHGVDGIAMGVGNHQYG